MIKVTFHVDGGEAVLYANEGENLLDAARRANVALDAPCSGNGACGKCRVRQLSGTLKSPRTHHITDAEAQEGWRLACCSKLVGDVEIEVPDVAAAYRSRMKIADLSTGTEKAVFRETLDALQQAGLKRGTNLFELSLVLTPPTLEDPMPDSERVRREICRQTGESCVEITYPALRKTARVLRENGFSARGILERTQTGVRLLDILAPKDDSPIAGVAVDLGTTSVAALLVDLQTGAVLAKASTGNAQIRYGADVINRIVEASKEGGSERLQRAILDETLKPLLQELCAAAKTAPARVYRMCLAGNTTMNHLLLGLYADPVRMEPYVPSFFLCDPLPARCLELGLHAEAKLFLAPNVGSYVGGDITAGALSSMLWRREPLSMLVDLGTNGELVLGNEEFLMCCACSAGPAFEGGEISCGMRATDGAIDSICIDRETLEPRYTVIGNAERPVGLCGSGLIDLVAELFATGLIDSRGRFVREGGRVRSDEYGTRAYVICDRSSCGGVRDLSITEVDLDAFIRAKGAIFSATMTLLEATGLTPELLDCVYIAGGIGSGINVRSAIRIGMLPDLPEDRFRYIGNTSLSGAYAMLTSDSARRRMEDIARSMTYLDLSNQPGYMDAFVAACFLPHTDASLFPSVTR